MTYGQDMHFIQRKILVSLARHSPQRFSELQPAQIPNNTFSYHLKKLHEAGYVSVIRGRGYVATRKALKILQHETSETKRTDAPTMLTSVFVTNSKNQVLLIRRRNIPFANWHAVPSGLVHQGENLEEAAKRELFEKTTLKIDTLSFAGVLDFQYLEKKTADLFVHTVTFVYSYRLSDSGKQYDGLETRHGTLTWSGLDHSNILPEVQDVASLARGRRPAVESRQYDEPTMSVWRDS